MATSSAQPKQLCARPRGLSADLSADLVRPTAVSVCFRHRRVKLLASSAAAPFHSWPPSASLLRLPKRCWAARLLSFGFWVGSVG